MMHGLRVLKTPILRKDIEELKAGDIVYLSGTIVTARDEAHMRILRFLAENRELPLNLKGLAIYHCGPIVRRRGDEWIVVAAGPTTSMRMESSEDKVIKNFGVRLIVGKGGMGKKTQESMKKFGAVYGSFTGGAAVLAARSVRKVKDVKWLDLGMPEALWVFEVENFGPLTIAIDAYGNNLFERVLRRAEEKKTEIYRKMKLQP